MGNAGWQAPTFADVNGDGELEVLLGSTDGGIHALRAKTGTNAEHFPVWAQVSRKSYTFPSSGCIKVMAHNRMHIQACNISARAFCWHCSKLAI